jgi:hypothetical protein
VLPIQGQQINEDEPFIDLNDGTEGLRWKSFLIGLFLNFIIIKIYLDFVGYHIFF